MCDADCENLGSQIGTRRERKRESLVSGAESTGATTTVRSEGMKSVKKNETFSWFVLWAFLLVGMGLTESVVELRPKPI